MKALLSGNEAVARGAWEGGVHVGCAYPGTPSTEIMEALSQYPEVYTEWSVNEKVSLEVASGASFAGARAMVAMKHVGLNVAADPLFSLSYIGATGGLVIVTCDDPGMHSSQNEQDNRHYARSAKVPLLEPSDSQEAKEFTRLAFEISEEFDTPVMVRLTTRISHSKSIVELGERKEVPVKEYVKDVKKRVILPAHARERHRFVEERMERLRKYAEEFPYNRIEEGDPELGIIADSVAYMYAKEVFPEASFLKLSMVWPFPRELVRRFASKVKKIIVVEENDPFIEEQVRLLGIEVTGKDKIPLVGELNPTRVAVCLGVKKEEELPKPELPHIPKRPPALCPGCPHTGVFNVIRKLKLIATGDIGCYTLGTLPPLNAMDTCVEMGASIGNAFGMQLVMKDDKLRKKVVAVIGDSTFFHSGITGLINLYYNRGITTVIILDNRTTAMTGHQDHPGTGKTAKGEKGREVDLVKLIKGIGIEHVYVVNPYDLKELTEVIKREIEREEPSVIIPRAPCVLLRRGEKFTPMRVIEDKCTGCRVCLKVGCPAISMRGDKARIDPFLCTGCTLCQQTCPFGAIEFVEEK
ncbi:indolepyruvate ferredoxin oxidoreductase subunit alpha [bacterium]|nr:MAG: indolepyruvate ferredoxin oxidoreductase subunit alpha [bacterium]